MKTEKNTTYRKGTGSFFKIFLFALICTFSFSPNTQKIKTKFNQQSQNIIENVLTSINY